ncbi:MAG TPA: Gmad2 immunoglobulin-like domain-containing protein [Nocardioidaceae bacterium]|nr:Gmad2 immunoglobulin-like domain-containing protein [Nocardioidaceae bacterium]
MTTPEHDDPLAELLRRSLAEESKRVEVDGAALQRIRERTARSRARARIPGWLLPSLAAAAAAAVVVVAVVATVELTGGGHATTPVAAQPSAAPRHSTGPTGAPTTAVRPSTPVQSAGGTVIVPPPHPGVYTPGTPTVTMYYVGLPTGITSQPYQLYAEPHSITSASMSPLAAIREFLTSTPIDPDYSRVWPAHLDVRGLLPGADSVTLALTGSASLGPPKCVSCAQYGLAVQALARTAGLAPGMELSVTLNGRKLDSVLGVPLPVKVRPYSSERASIQITSPVYGQSLRGPVTVRGNANVFEGNVTWKLLDANGRQLRKSFTTAAMGMWKRFSIRLGSLAPGTYTIVAYEQSAKDGSVLHADSKQFTVR